MNAFSSLLSNSKTTKASETVKNIDSYGFHKGFLVGVHGRIVSFCKWSDGHNKKRLHEYVLEQCKQNTVSEISSQGDEEVGSFLETFNLLAEDFEKSKMPTEVYLDYYEHWGARKHTTLAFAVKHYPAILEKVAEQKKGLENLVQIRVHTVESVIKEAKDAYGISSTKKLLADNEIKQAIIETIANKVVESHMKSIWPIMFSILKITVIFEISFLFAGLVFTYWIANMTLAMTLAGVVASLSIPVLDGCLSGIKEVIGEPSFVEMLFKLPGAIFKAIQKNWQICVKDPHSFYPIVDAFWISYVLTLVWDCIAGYYGCMNFIFFYMAMNVIFKWSETLHKGQWFSKEIFYSAFLGALRGCFKNMTHVVQGRPFPDTHWEYRHDIATTVESKAFELIVDALIKKISYDVFYKLKLGKAKVA